jgi:hypothetical protein
MHNLISVSKIVSKGRKEIGDCHVLKTLSALNRVMNYHAGKDNLDTRINERARTSGSRYVVNGKMFVYIWSRDCDCVESECIRKVNVCNMDLYINRVAESAEGAMRVYRVTEQEYLEYVQPQPRDRILEAFEEGRNYHV